ncbi:MAG: CoA-disulfide reductase [Candidatus Onthovivens sp.]|nr:CoA-disulfide reductase [Candidatus Onthovivens sp.]
MKVVIIGGVAGGATAAARIRRLDEQAEIIVFERSGFISYANCGLPYYIGGTIEDENKLTLQTPESFWRRFRVKVNVHHEVIAIHPDSKTVTVKNLENDKIFTESYDKLLLSPGAKPIKPRFEGIDSDKIFTIRTVEDTLRLKKYTDEHQLKSAVVVGGGFIGIEVAENLHDLGIDITLVEASDQLMAPFDRDMASFIHSEILKNGIHLMLDTMVEGFADTDCGIDVKLKNGQILHTDMVVMAIGVAPETNLAKDAGIELGIKGSIVVNDKMETSIPDVYAVGDAVQIKNFVTDKDTLISLAGPANKQGRIAADNICGGNSHYNGGQGSSVIKIFDMTAAATGINEKTAKLLGINADKVILSPMSHAGYYPGGKIMTLKVLFEKDTYRLLGAQIVGFDGVDKRIDVLATAIRAGIKAYELTELDLAYAPPYSSAKDPVNMAGYIIENIKNGIVKQWYYEEDETLPRDGSITLLDTRTPMEYRMGHAKGFINIPVDELRERIDELDKSKPVYIICQSGLRSYIASRILMGNGFDAYNFAGGFRFYNAVHNDKALNKKSTPCGMDD